VSEGIPRAGENPQAWCDFQNAALIRDDIEWIVGHDGGLHLRTKPGVLAQRIKAEDERRKREARHHAHRQAHPITRTADMFEKGDF